MEFDKDDVGSLALVAWKEARGEGLEGCRAVMQVCCNRVGQPGFGHTLHDVIYGKNQFTSMSVPGDPEFNLKPPPGDALFAQCQAKALEVLSSSDLDPTLGAQWYANLAHIDRGGWFERHICGPDGKGTSAHPVTIIIGHHTFFA